MPRSRPIKRLSASELTVTELLKQPMDLLDRGWIQQSAAGHAAAGVLARKPNGSWRICYHYRRLNAIICPAVEPLTHIDALLDSTHGSCFFTKLDLVSAYHQLSAREKDRWKDKLLVATGPVRVEGRPIRPSGGLLPPDADHECNPHSRGWSGGSQQEG
jgi:hypothetical protein